MRMSSMFYAVLIAVPFVGGCLGDAAADRTLRIHQLQSDGCQGRFEVDTSKLPADSVKVTKSTDHWGSPVDTYDVEIEVPFRVVLIPTTRP